MFRRVLVHERLIPACAGRASSRCRTTSSARAHPRMRGEGVQHLLEEADRQGSSPHARGGQQAHLRGIRRLRLIPACAGRAPHPAVPAWQSAAHPRMRGEGRFPVRLLMSPMGSSPHARGGLLQSLLRDLHGRLIPACAGRALVICDVVIFQPAHPRMRGEGTGSPYMGSPGGGSSPHARGGRGRGGGDGSDGRLIPACAGRATTARLTAARPGAHPRMRGEGLPTSNDYVEAWGSSPHARGGRVPPVGDHGSCGLIPACAGRA